MERELFRENLVRETEKGTFLVGRKCTSCGKIQFPNSGFCTDCLCEENEEVLIGRKGTLFSHTITNGRVAKLIPPFAVGYIEIPEGLRVFAPLKMEEGKEFSIGMDMELEIGDLWEEDGVIKTGYVYKIAE